MIQSWIYSKLSHQAEVSLEANRQNYSAILSISRSVPSTSKLTTDSTKTTRYTCC